MNYKEWLNEWLSTCVKPMVKSRTFEKYDEIVRLKIEPSLGDCDLAELSPSMLQRFTAELTEKYASNTVSGIIAVVRSSLTRAQKTGGYRAGVFKLHSTTEIAGEEGGVLYRCRAEEN